MVRNIRKAFTALYFLANRNFGNFELAVKDEAIVDVPWVVYVCLTRIEILCVGNFYIFILRGVILPLLVPLQWFRRPRLAE